MSVISYMRVLYVAKALKLIEHKCSIAQVIILANTYITKTTLKHAQYTNSVRPTSVSFKLPRTPMLQR